MNVLRRVLDPVASLKLTVALFAMSMFLIFAGTLAQAQQGTWTVVWSYFRSFVAWVDMNMFVPPQLAGEMGHLPFPGGATLIILLLVNLIAAHVVRFKVNRKRIGIIMIHAGLILLLAGELATAAFAEEGNMTIDEGSSSNYVEDIREVELAVIDASPEDHDAIVAVPESRLRSGRVSEPALPFDITVHDWMVNSQPVGPAMATPAIRARSRANAGIGTQVFVVPAPETTGAEQSVNAPSAYVTLTSRDGEDLGTYLVSLWFEQRQPVKVDDKTYFITMRFKRTYKPYTLHLIDFRHDKFTGTEIARNFSSQIRLVDPAHNEDREVLIWMNHPLRYDGETFYQSAFKPDESGTILQVVRNPAWLAPYLSCVLVGVGMIWHFAGHLRRSLRRQLS